MKFPSRKKPLEGGSQRPGGGQTNLTSTLLKKVCTKDF